MNNIHDKLTKFYANNIIQQNPENTQKIGLSNTGTTLHYLQYDIPNLPSTNMVLPICVGCQTGKNIQSIKPCLLYFSPLPDKACEVHIMPSITPSSLV